MTDLIQSADAYHLRELIQHDNKIFYVVPRYQREYTWGKNEWEKLLDDVLEDRSAETFLGTIICVNVTRGAAKGSKLELIDGQQRMTTLSLLLSAVWKKLADLGVPRELEDGDWDYEFGNLKRRLITDKQPRVQLQHQNSNNRDYEYLFERLGLLAKGSETQPKNWGNRRIAKAFKFFNSYLDDILATLETHEDKLRELFNILDSILDSVIVQIEVGSYEAAFVLFESLNNRGVPLSAIDLIKNNLLALATQEESGFKGSDQKPVTVEAAYAQWQRILNLLGDNPANQERFLRYYWNAFEPVKASDGTRNFATKSNLIRLYESYLKNGVRPFLENLEIGAEAYSAALGEPSELISQKATTAMKRLQRAQGAPGNVLLLYLIVNKDTLDLTDEELLTIVNQLTAFFVRRNITGRPSTSDLQRMFRDIVRQISGAARETRISEIVGDRLLKVSADDLLFREALSGPIYTDNADMTRFILASLAEANMTNESFSDLWARTSQQKRPYAWSIEHIFPQGDNIPESWVAMMGGAEQAQKALENHVHKLGNLTLTANNSSLGNRSFEAKKNHKNSSGHYIGFRNGLSINAPLVAIDQWDANRIIERTEMLVDDLVRMYSLESIAGSAGRP